MFYIDLCNGPRCSLIGRQKNIIYMYTYESHDCTATVYIVCLCIATNMHIRLYAVIIGIFNFCENKHSTLQTLYYSVICTNKVSKWKGILYTTISWKWNKTRGETYIQNTEMSRITFNLNCFGLILKLIPRSIYPSVSSVGARSVVFAILMTAYSFVCLLFWPNKVVIVMSTTYIWSI